MRISRHLLLTFMVLLTSSPLSPRSVFRFRLALRFARLRTTNLPPRTVICGRPAIGPGIPTLAIITGYREPG
jgi:hypothetical protein